MPWANAHAARARSGSPPMASTNGSAARASRPSGSRSLVAVINTIDGIAWLAIIYVMVAKPFS